MLWHHCDADIPDFGDFGFADVPSTLRVRTDARRPSRKGLLVGEVPMRPDLMISEPGGIYERIGCPPAHRESITAIELVVANMFEAELKAPGKAVFYSRDRNHYSRGNLSSRYVPAYYTYRQILAAVAALESAGLIDHKPTPPSPYAVHRSRIWARPELLALCTAILVVSRPPELIIRKDRNRKAIPYDDSRDLNRLRHDICAQNESIATLCIRISDACEERDAAGRLYRDLYAVRSLYRPFRRIFNGGWTSGGRWFGPPWQTLPKTVRSELLMGGEPVIEVDFRTCHPRLLCALAGMDLPFHDDGFDYYDLPGFPRKHVKRAFSTLLNAPSKRSAVMALAQEIGAAEGRSSIAYAQRLLDEAIQRLPGLSRTWRRPGIGLRLQYRDAQICKRVQCRLRRAGVSVLSVHDSFLVARRHEDLLREAMDDEMEVECRRLRHG